jgi:Xaa-Pro aminopeptidase
VKNISKYLFNDKINFKKNYRSLSFDSISAVGSHAADIHFSTNVEEDRVSYLIIWFK